MSGIERRLVEVPWAWAISAEWTGVNFSIKRKVKTLETTVEIGQYVHIYGKNHRGDPHLVSLHICVPLKLGVVAFIDKEPIKVVLGLAISSPANLKIFLPSNVETFDEIIKKYEEE